jgi:hypothetical protein
MLLRHCLPAACLLRRWASQLVGVLLPGQDFPAPCQARRGIRADRAIVLILQWARIVTESQSVTATGIIPGRGTPLSRKYNARTPKKRCPCTIPATGFSRVFHRLRASWVLLGRTGGFSSPTHSSFPALRPLPPLPAAVQTRQALRPSVIRSCGNSMPIKTILLFFFSTGCHLAARSLPII